MVLFYLVDSRKKYNYTLRERAKAGFGSLRKLSRIPITVVRICSKYRRFVGPGKGMYGCSSCEDPEVFPPDLDPAQLK